MSQRLIVNADDFGRSAGVNRGIAVAHEQGIVTSASLMVRRPAAGEAGAYASRHHELSVGLHVDMGEWEYRDGAWEIVVEPPASVERELIRQLEMFRRMLGRDPTHLDSHQHVHREEPAASTLASLANQLGIPLRGRDPRIAFRGDFYGQTAKGEPLHDAINVEALLGLLRNLAEGVTELACHPGLGTDDDLPYGVERSLEVRALCDARVRELIAQRQIELCSFADVAYV
jgi:predicted glycoside hydrolase/deacetylase ChbG (UPF0249 family)